MKRAHPDLNQGPADLQSAALTTELCTHVKRSFALCIRRARTSKVACRGPLERRVRWCVGPEREAGLVAAARRSRFLDRRVASGAGAGSWSKAQSEGERAGCWTRTFWLSKARGQFLAKLFATYAIT